MGEKKIVILGGSWGGVQSAHYFLKHIYPRLPKDSSTYKVVMISPSPKMFWRVAGVRLIVSKDMPQDKYFLDIASNFKNYPSASFDLIEASATSLDTDSRTVTYSLTKSGATETIDYHALIIATGVSSYTDAFNHLGPEEVIQNDLEQWKAKIWAAKSIIIGGGGPTSVETAGEIGSHINGEPSFFGWLFGGPNKAPKVPVTIITADSKILPFLSSPYGKRAEQFLTYLGVNVRYNSRIESVSSDEKGSTTVTLANGETLSTDLYIPAIGVKPNTSIFPPSILTERGHINSTLAHRVPSAGPRVFAVGDVSGHLKKAGIYSIAYAQIPVLMTNLERDLIAYKSSVDEKENVSPGPDRELVEDMRDAQLVPTGRKKGVIAGFGWRLPTFLVYYAKGKDYMLWIIPKTLKGEIVAKESKWKPTA